MEHIAVVEIDELRNEAESYKKRLGTLTSPKVPWRDCAKPQMGINPPA